MGEPPGRIRIHGKSIAVERYKKNEVRIYSVILRVTAYLPKMLFCSFLGELIRMPSFCCFHFSLIEGSFNK